MSAGLWLAVAVVGGAAAIGRFLLDSLVSGRSGRDLPFGTFAVNASGALALGLLAGLAASGDLLLLAGTAALGSYTTFSTWMLETQRLAEDAELRGALANCLISLAPGVAAALIGHAIGSSL